MRHAAALLALLLSAAPGAAQPFDGTAPAEALVTAPSPPIDGAASAAAVRELLARFTPARLEQLLAERPPLAAGVLGTLARAFEHGPEPLREQLGTFAGSLVRARARRLDAEHWQAADIERLRDLAVLDVERFGRHPALRGRLLAALATALDPSVSPALRRALLSALRPLPGLDFEAVEALAWGWRAVARPSGARRRPPGRYRLAAAKRSIAASIYVLGAPYVSADQALALLQAVRAQAPARRLIVLTDGATGERLAPRAEALGMTLIDTLGEDYSPWPRDPVTLVTRADGGLHVLLRPNAQPDREADAWLGRTLVQQLPDDLDRAWGEVTWSWSPVPFHNGQTLFTPDAAWISLHSVEQRALALLGLERVPVASFGAPAGVDRYVQAVQAAAEELATLYGQPVRFVHPLPGGAAHDASEVAIHDLAGGAGFDLDSLVALLPAAAGGRVAMVADLELGAALLTGAEPEALAALAAAYGLSAAGDALRWRLRQAQASPRARALQTFLDTVADHLTGHGSVARLPLLLVPMSLHRTPAAYPNQDFLITWTNVVLERSPGDLRAEGFAGRFAPGDRLAVERFAAAGYRLTLLPPLVESVLRSGGYRCASQHVRVGPSR